MTKEKIVKYEAGSAFIRCMSQFAERDVKLQIEENRGDAGHEIIVKITPTGHEAASIEANLELDFGVYLFCGVKTEFEIPFLKTYYTGKGWLTELEILCRAVANGKLQERLVYVENRLAYCKYELVLEDGKIIRGSWGIRPILPWRKTHAVERHYAAYGIRSTV